MIQGWYPVWRKELLNALRDRRSLLAAMAYPLLGPVLMALAFYVAVQEATTTEQVEVELQGIEHAPALYDFLVQHGVDHADDAAMSLTIPGSYATDLARAKPVRLVFAANYSDRSGQSDRQQVEQLLQQYNQQLAQQRLILRGISPEVVQPLNLVIQDTGTQGARTAMVLGTVMVFVLMSVFFTGMNVAIDSSAGERERNVLEFLLAQPVTTTALVLGKMLSAAVFAAAGAWLTLLLIPVTFYWVPLEQLGVDFNLTLVDSFLLTLVLLPLALFASMLQLFVSFRAASFKEAQTYISFVMFIPVATVFVLEFTRFEHALLKLLPVTSQHQVLLGAIRATSPDWWALLGGACVTLAAAMGLLIWVSRMLRQEQVIFGHA